MKSVDSSGDGLFQKWNKLLKICPSEIKPSFEFDSE